VARVKSMRMKAGEPERQSMDMDHEYYDEFGFYNPMPLSRPVRGEPGPDFPTEPEVGERLSDFRLPDQLALYFIR
jgi:hypothetical protein